AQQRCQITVTATAQTAFLLADEQRAIAAVDGRGRVGHDAGQKRTNRYGTRDNPFVVPEQIKQCFKTYCIRIAGGLTLFGSEDPTVVSAVIGSITAVRIISVVQGHPFLFL